MNKYLWKYSLTFDDLHKDLENSEKWAFLCDIALVERDHVGACFILWLNIYDFDVDRVQDQFK